MYKIFARIYPKVIREKIRRLIVYSDIKFREEEFIGLMFFSSLCLAIFFSLVISIFAKFNILIFILLFVVFQFFSYFMLILKADKKARFIEGVLPDALQLTASNLRAGLTSERAFLLSARPEFGYFSEELTLVGKKMAGGKTLESALLDLSQRIKSEKLSKTVQLIISGVKSGGELASLLSQTAQNLINQEIVEAKVKASVLMYFIFISAAICFAAPVLFALSSFLAEVITNQLAMVEIPTDIGIETPIAISKSEIEPSFIMNFILAVLTTLCVFGPLILGVIKEGDLKEGLKYLPILLTCSLGIFFLVRMIIKNLFGFFF